MVEHLPRAGESLVATGLHMEPGGKGLNVAIGIARLVSDAKVQVILGIGRDAAADAVLQLLTDAGIGVEHVHRLAEHSGYGSGHIAKGGQNAIAVFPGPNLLLTAHHADLASASIARADVVYAQFETSQALILRALELAKRTKKDKPTITVLNPSPWQSLSPELLQWVDVLVVNEMEAAELLHLPTPLAGLGLALAAERIEAALPALWAMWPAPENRQLVVTLGGQGSAYFCSNGERVQAPGFAVDAVDTVGCGDAFSSALCVALAHGHSMAQALRQANACGALLASQAGVLNALPKHDALMHFIHGASSR